LSLEAIGVSVGIDAATGDDYLKIHDTHYTHPALDEPVEFYGRSTDTENVERAELLESDNNVISDYGDYDPVEKFEQEEGLRPRTPLRLIPTAPTPAPKKRTPQSQTAVSRCGTALNRCCARC